MKARKKPITIDYYPIGGNIQDLHTFVESFGDKFEDVFVWDIQTGFQVKTLEGTSYQLSSEDVLLRGVNGEYYPCKKEIFEKTYDTI